MENKIEHTLQDNVLGEIRYETPWNWTVVYGPGNDWEIFPDIIHVAVMKTGCYVLTQQHSGNKIVLAPGHHRYIIERPTV